MFISVRSHFFVPILFLLSAAPAAAITGHASVALKQSRSAVMIVGARGTVCTGAAIAADLVLTAGHCTVSGNDYKIADGIGLFGTTLATVTGISRHPKFSLQTMLAHRATADVALMKLSRPLPKDIVPAMLSRSTAAPKPGDRFTVMGYGVTGRDNEGSLGTLRAASLVATGQPGNLQLRLVDPATKGVRFGMGACTGDSGAPVYENGALVGVVSWSTGPNLEDGCGGLTGVTPLTLYRGWIAETAQKLGSPLAP
jgi:secreted trypsin-like serine protease